MTKNGQQLTKHAPLEVAVMCYPGSQSTSIHGLTDVFAYADFYARELSGIQQPFVRVTHWRERAGSDGSSDAIECTFDSLPGPHHPPALIIIPGSQIAPPERGHSPRCQDWIRGRHADGAVVAAVCGGVFLLADSGLLDGRRATTHWLFADELRRRFPALDVDADRLVIDDQDVITAGGVLAWADLGLSLVERLLGAAVMHSTARFMVMDPPGREQRLYGDFAPRLQHGDKAILAIQHWLQANANGACSVSDLAERASLGERTFLRRFVKATGVKPSEYHQRLRVARSRELLEFTRDSVEQIAVAAGYEDPGGFRRIFKRVIGLSPGEYRRRFQRERLITRSGS